MRAAISPTACLSIPLILISVCLVAQRALEKGVKDVVFDRGGYIYHGRVKALADAAREAGLNF